MGLQEDLSSYLETGNSTSKENLLTTIRQDLKEFQEDLVVQLTQDIGQLQAEKVQLLSDISQLRQQKQTLESQAQLSLSQKQIAQQQLWAKQLAQALASRLYILLSDKVQNGSGHIAPYNRQPIHTATTFRRFQSTEQGLSNTDSEHALSSLNTAVNETLASLKQDLDSYQSSINQQLNRMQSLENQGEAILDALVNRLNQHLKVQSADSTLHPFTSSSGGIPSPQLPPLNQPSYSGPIQHPYTAHFPTVPPGNQVGNVNAPFPPTPQGYGVHPATIQNYPSGNGMHSFPQVYRHGIGENQEVSPSGNEFSTSSPHFTEHLHPPKHQKSLKERFVSIPAFQKGLILILLSTIALSLHNVVVQIIGNESSVFNIWRVGGYISLVSLDSSLMILWLRMIVVMPLMAALATFLYPATWSDIKRFALSKDRRQLRNVISSGFFLFLSQVCIYIAIGQVGAGVAVTILFMYPIFTVPLAWWLFSDRPTPLRILVMIGIFAGVVCTFFPEVTITNEISILGIGTAVFAGLAFACYLISMQLSFKKLHPVPVSVIQFFTIFTLTSIILLMRPATVEPSNPVGLVVGGVVLGTLTLLGYLFNNFGVRFMGAARASIIASSGPALTALLAFLIIDGEKTRLAPVQILGILIVTAGVTALALERLIMQRRLIKKKKHTVSNGASNKASQSVT